MYVNGAYEKWMFSAFINGIMVNNIILTKKSTVSVKYVN